jgi:O-antigen ligase
MSEDIRRALRDWKSYWLILVYVYIAYNLVSPRLRRTVFWTLFASMTASCIVALTQYRGGVNLLFFRIESDDYRPGGTLYAMTFAGILYQLTTVNFAIALKDRALNKTKLIIAGGVVVQIVALLINLTRGAWLALAGGVLAVPLVLRRRLVFFVGVALVAVVCIGAFQNDTLRARAVTIVRSLRAPTDANVATRLVLWEVSWEMFKQHPWLGVGSGDFSIEAEKLLRERKVLTTVDAHNIYLQRLTTRGLVGFIPFIIFWVALFHMLASARMRLADASNRFGFHFVAGVTGAAVAVLIGALSENNIDDAEVFTAFMMLMGMARSFALWPDPDEALL